VDQRRRSRHGGETGIGADMADPRDQSRHKDGSEHETDGIAAHDQADALDRYLLGIQAHGDQGGKQAIAQHQKTDAGEQRQQRREGLPEISQSNLR
jgi:hypothetical protein